MEVFEKEGHVTIAAESGEEAVELFGREKTDFVCLDIMMPGKNGYEVCREIRKRSADVPVLILSAKAEEIDRVVGLDIGADDYIVKPFGVKELLARVNAVYRRYQGRSASQATFTMNELEVSPSELRAFRGGLQIDLTGRDVKLLSYFAANRGKVVSRNELFDVGWGFDFLPTSRSLDQYISQLRKKIEIDPKNPRIIATVHTVGYRYP